MNASPGASPNEIVIAVWGIVALYASISIGYAIRRGWFDGPDKAVRWKGLKVLGAFLGTVGLITGALSFGKVIRELNQHAYADMKDRFIQLKFDTTAARAMACSGDQSSQETKNECFDFTTIDRLLYLPELGSHGHLSPIENWQNKPYLDDFAKRINVMISEVNEDMDFANERQIPSLNASIELAVFSILFITTALAITIGESTFQWQQARQELRRVAAGRKS